MHRIFIGQTLSHDRNSIILVQRLSTTTQQTFIVPWSFQLLPRSKKTLTSSWLRFYLLCRFINIMGRWKKNKQKFYVVCRAVILHCVYRTTTGRINFTISRLSYLFLLGSAIWSSLVGTMSLDWIYSNKL